MSNKISAEVKAKVNEIFAWCLENHDSEGFCVFVRMSGHINQIQIEVHLDGWKYERDAELTLYIGMKSIDIDKALSRLKSLKAKYDAENTLEAKAEREEKAKQERIAKLKAELGELEGE